MTFFLILRNRRSFIVYSVTLYSVLACTFLSVFSKISNPLSGVKNPALFRTGPQRYYNFPNWQIFLQIFFKFFEKGKKKPFFLAYLN